VEKPADFQDLQLGDSIACNGVCLTLEAHDGKTMTFSLGPETLKITQWTPKAGDLLNLERSLRLGDRIHGHFVNGHVDEIGKILDVQHEKETTTVTIEAPKIFTPYLWRKGSVALHGVSLTINDVDGQTFKVGLIPETLKRTSLKNLKAGDTVNLEADAMARAWFHWRNTQ
jgi:riboflavin synthase